MKSDTYQPWRTDDHPDDLLADDVAAQWRQLLGESRQCIGQLRHMTREAELRLNQGTGLIALLRQTQQDDLQRSHDRIFRQLNQFEQRLTGMEKKLAALAGPQLHTHKHAA